MTRVITISTAIGLLGLVLAMLAALSSALSTGVVGLGFVMMTLGLLGAVIGAATSLGQAWQSAR